MSESIINIGIYVTYVLVAIAVIGAVVFPIIQFGQDIRKAKGTLIGLAGLLVVIFFSYLISTAEPYEAHGYGPTVSQWVGAGINATMLLIGLGLLAAIFTEVYKFFR